MTDPDDCAHERTAPTDDGGWECLRCPHVFAPPAKPKRVPAKPEQLERVRQLRAEIRRDGAP